MLLLLIQFRLAYIVQLRHLLKKYLQIKEAELKVQSIFPELDNPEAEYALFKEQVNTLIDKALA